MTVRGSRPELDAVPAVPQARHAEGWAVVETFTVKHSRTGTHTGIVVGRLEDTGVRFLAMPHAGDEETLALLSV